MKNYFEIVGNIGRKPELKTAKSGVKYLQFSVAVSEKFTPKGKSEEVEKTNWFNLVVFDQKAESLSKVLDQGTQVSVTGKLQVKAQEIDGKKIWNPDLVVLNVDVLNSNSDSIEKDTLFEE